VLFGVGQVAEADAGHVEGGASSGGLEECRSDAHTKEWRLAAL